MARLIVLRLIGNLEVQGYQVTLEISEEGKRADAEETGFLPAHEALADKITAHWRDKYRNLVAPYRRKSWATRDDISQIATTDFTARIKPKKISYDGSVNARIRECKASADELEALFLCWLDSEGFRPIDKCLRSNLNRSEATRFLIRAEDPQLQRLPWHAWDLFRVFESEPAFSPPRLQAFPKVPVSEDKRSVKILAILGHSAGINVEEDRALLKKLAPDTHFLVEPDRKAITDQLWEQPWDIIFFAGHSETEGETGKIYINPYEYLTLDDLWYGLRKAVEKGLQVAIFNSCDGLGLAQRLINDFQIPNLIVMRELVPDRVAQEFLKYFLSAFAGGRPFHLAAREARERLQSLEGNYPCASWLPTIYQNPLEAALYWRDLTAPGEAAPEEEATPADKTPKQRIPIFRCPTWREVRRATATSLLVTSLVMGVRWLGVLEPVELIAYDHLMRMRPTDLDPHDKRILIVEATPEDETMYGYPLKDHILTQVIKKIKEKEPIAIGLNMHRGTPQSSDQCQAEETCAAERQALLTELQETDKLTAVCATVDANGDSYSSGGPYSPAEGLSNNQVGFSDLLLDRDYGIRRQLISYNPNYLPYVTDCTAPNSFSFSLAYRFLTELSDEQIYQMFKDSDHSSLSINNFINKLNSAKDVEITKNEEWRFGDSTFARLARDPGGYQNISGRSNQILINYRTTRQPATTVPVRTLLADEVPSAWFENRIVLIGTSNHRRFPFLKTPYGDMPAVWVQAHIISHLLDFTLEKRPLIWFMPKTLEGLSLILVGTIFALGGLSLGRKSQILAWIFVATGGLYIISYTMLAMFGGWMPLVPSMLIVALISMDILLVTGRKNSWF
jgi:CHASE2 domain-containing sensor protein